MSYFDEDYYFNLKLKQLISDYAIDPGTGRSYTLDGLQAAFRDAGLTPQQHYELYGRFESLNPNPYFDAYEYLQAKVNQLHSVGEKDAAGHDYTTASLARLLDALGLTAVTHYERYGSHERDKDGDFINPSNAFDANAYYSAKLAELQAADSSWTIQRLVDAMTEAGLSPVSHYEDYGAAEAAKSRIAMVETVPDAARVYDDKARETFGEVVPGNPYSPTAPPLGQDRGHAAAHPADVGHKAPDSLSPPVTHPAHNLNPDPNDVGGDFPGGLDPSNTVLGKDVTGRLHFNGPGLVDFAIDNGQVVFAKDGYARYHEALQSFTGLVLAEDQILRLDQLTEMAALFARQADGALVDVRGPGTIMLDITAITDDQWLAFAKPASGENNARLDLGLHAGELLVSSGIYKVSSTLRQFMQGPRLDPAVPETNVIFSQPHMINHNNIKEFSLINESMLIATKGQASLLDGMTITGNGSVHIKADLRSGADGGVQTFTVQTTGENYIAAGQGRDTIVLGEGTGVDTLIFKYNDSQYGLTQPRWSMVKHIETGRDKLAFISTWQGTTQGPTSVFHVNVHQGQMFDFGDFTAADGIITYTSADAAFAAESVFTKIGKILDDLDAAVATNSNGIKADDVWAYMDRSSQSALEQSVYILKADGKPGHNPDYKAGYENDTPGDTVIELVGVTVQNGAALAGMLNPDVGGVYWG
jgi:hypothetical protein